MAKVRKFGWGGMYGGTRAQQAAKAGQQPQGIATPGIATPMRPSPNFGPARGFGPTTPINQSSVNKLSNMLNGTPVPPVLQPYMQGQIGERQVMQPQMPTAQTGANQSYPPSVAQQVGNIGLAGVSLQNQLSAPQQKTWTPQQPDLSEQSYKRFMTTALFKGTTPPNYDEWKQGMNKSIAASNARLNTPEYRDYYNQQDPITQDRLNQGRVNAGLDPFPMGSSGIGLAGIPNPTRPEPTGMSPTQSQAVQAVIDKMQGTKLSGFKKGGAVKKKPKKMASGGKVSSASKRGDGCAIRGKTRGKIC